MKKIALLLILIIIPVTIGYTTLPSSINSDKLTKFTEDIINYWAEITKDVIKKVNSTSNDTAVNNTTEKLENTEPVNTSLGETLI